VSAEAKVGLLVIVVSLLAVGLAIYLSGALRSLGSYQIVVQFADVQGLDTGSPVRLGGVNIGRVTQVRLRQHTDFPGKPAAVTMQIDPDTILYATDRFEIKQGALVGDKYVSITRPADARGPRQRLDAGDVIGGGGASSAEVVMQEVRELIAEARVSVDAINAVVTDVEMQQDLKGTMANLRQATERAVLLSERTVEVVEVFTRAGRANEARLAQIMQNLITASEAVEGSTRQVERMLATSPIPAQMATAGDNIRVASQDIAAIATLARETAESTTIDDDAQAAMANLRLASENLVEVSASIEELASDEEMAANVRASLVNIREATESLQAATRAAEELMTDEQVNEDLRVTVHEARQAAEAGRETLDQTRRVLSDVEGTMQTVRDTQEMFTQIDARSRLDFRHISGEGVRADASFDIRLTPQSPNYWRVGLRDIEDSPKLDLQYAQPLGRGFSRVGLFGGQAGVGYEWGTGALAGIEAEFYNIDDPRLDLRYRFMLQDQYRLLLGFERVLHGTDPMFGIRYQGDF
jgi:phospholipid/cholesterol/gamma-HCH transport system substrate-binding protein